MEPLDKGNCLSAWTCCFIEDLSKIYVGRRHVNPTPCTSYMADPEILVVVTLPSTECVCLPEENNVACFQKSIILISIQSVDPF